MSERDASVLLRALRWEEDDLVTNYEGRRVWLKACFHDGRRIGITDCCAADAPCDWHKGLAAAKGSR